jgi:hypothetical protein
MGKIGEVTEPGEMRQDLVDSEIGVVGGGVGGVTV